jgi:hypothetical protein
MARPALTALTEPLKLSGAISTLMACSLLPPKTETAQMQEDPPEPFLFTSHGGSQDWGGLVTDATFPLPWAVQIGQES